MRILFHSYRPSQETPHHTMNKYIVYEDNLLQLFKSCPSCNQRCTVEKNVQGTLLSITQTCTHCEDSSTWKSQPHIGKIAAGNLQLSAATAFTGSSFVQIKKVTRLSNSSNSIGFGFKLWSKFWSTCITKVNQ